MRKTSLFRVLVCGLMLAAALPVALPVLAQSAQQTRARAQYFMAEEAYDSGQYAQALAALAKAETMLGGTNPVLSALKVKILTGQKDYGAAKKELDRFFGLKPGTGVLREMSRYTKLIDDGIVAERNRIEAARVAEINRKEASRLAAIKRKKDAELAAVKYQKDLRKSLIPYAERRVEYYQKVLAKVTKNLEWYKSCFKNSLGPYDTFESCDSIRKKYRSNCRSHVVARHKSIESFCRVNRKIEYDDRNEAKAELRKATSTLTKLRANLVPTAPASKPKATPVKTKSQ